MTKRSTLTFFKLFFFFAFSFLVSAQEEEATRVYKNQISTNLLLPIFESFDLNYERTIANKWAIGLGTIIYGEPFNELSSVTSSYGTRLNTNYEVTPFVRVYFQGAQNKSHFLELFGSVSAVEEAGRFVRSTNTAGFGVYNREKRLLTLGGLGIGYGYRFLLMDEKLVIEAQFALRTNFETNFILPAVAPVRAGIKVGYRF